MTSKMAIIITYITQSEIEKVAKFRLCSCNELKLTDAILTGYS